MTKSEDDTTRKRKKQGSTYKEGRTLQGLKHLRGLKVQSLLLLDRLKWFGVTDATAKELGWDRIRDQHTPRISGTAGLQP